MLKPKHLAEAVPHLVVANRHDYRPVGGLERLVDGENGVGAATGSRFRFASEEAGDARCHQRQVGVEQRDVDQLALTRTLLTHKGRSYRKGRYHPRDDVRERCADPLWRPSACSGDAHETGASLRDEIVPGPVTVRTIEAEAGEGAVDETREPGTECLRVEAEPLELARVQVLDKNVG